MYVRQARPLGCRGWEAARRKVEKDEKDGGLPGTKGVGRRGSMPRRGGEGPRVHFAYNLLALDIPEVMLYRSCHRPSSSRSSLPLLPAIALTPYYDRVDLSPFLALVFPSFTRPMLIPVVIFLFLSSYDLVRFVWSTGRHNSRSLPPKYLMRHAIFTISTPWQTPALKA